MTLPPRRLAWLLAIVLLVAGAYLAVRSRRDLVDFEVYLTAGERLRAAEPLYRESDGHYQFKYLPAFAMAMVPWTWVPAESAKAVWFGLSVGLVAFFIRQSIRAVPDRRLAQRALAWLTVLCMGKFIVRELVHGQTNVLLGVVLIGALGSRSPAGGGILAGALVGLGVFIKPYAVVFLPWLAVAFNRRAVAAALAVVAVGLALPALVYGWSGNVDQLAGWYHTVTATTAPNLLLPENISLLTMWAKWLGVGETAERAAVLSALIVLAVAVGTVVLRRRVNNPTYLEFGFLMLLVPLLSPQGWDYVLLLAAPAVLLILDRWAELAAPWRTIALLSIVLTSFTIYDLLGRWLYMHLAAASVVSVGALGLVAATAHLRWRALA